MSQPLDRFEELEKLLNSLADDELDTAGRTRIGELLDGDPEACEFYLDFMALNAHLEQELGSMEPVQFLEKLPQAQIEEATTIYLATRQPQPPPTWKQPWTMAAAAAVIGGMFLISLMINQEKDRIAQEDATSARDNAVAVLTETIDARFIVSGSQPARGDLLPKGTLKLDSGVARLQFYSGVELILEGPVEFELLGENSGSCAAGNFRASVPRAAQGFTVLSPQVEMVDLGTEFGASIQDDGTTEVHVFKGEVEVYATGSDRDPTTRSLLTAGYGLQVGADGTRADMLADNMAFISEDEVLQRMRLKGTQSHDAWQRFSADRLDRDERVVAHYPFVSDSTEARVLLDKAELGGLRNGIIIGSRWVSGRWPGKRALAFDRSSDRVIIDIKKKSPSLTMITWVKVDRLDQRYSALLLTDHQNQNGVEWQITRAGALQFGIRKNSRTTESYTSPVVFTDRLGKWTQVAVTLDRETRMVHHSLNGRRVGSQPLKSNIQPRIGRAQIGNWKAPREGDSYPVRNLRGRMDEFLIFDKAISSDELLEIYQIGQP